jgi:hypothetical protein
MIRSHDRSPERTPFCRLGRCLLRQAFRLGRGATRLFFLSVSVPEDTSTSIINIWSVRGLRSAGYYRSTLGSLGPNERKRWKKSSSGYPAAMLAAWMALERRPSCLLTPLDFIVTVNKGTEPPDCWIFLHSCEQRTVLRSYFSLLGRT